ncbi:MAG: thioredoxin family protein [Myxococcota bacterium]
MNHLRVFALVPALFVAGGACRAPTTSPARTLDSCDPPPSHATGSLRWYEDQWEEAVACAEKLGRRVVIDLWAPWCHTCLSMQQTVLSEPSFGAWTERFVWVSLDTDRDLNAEVVKKYPPLAWPTFYVVEPSRGTIASRFVGGASKAQFEAFLEVGEAAAAPETVEALVARAHAEEAEKRWSEAGRIYDQALEVAPSDWPRRPDILVSRIRAHVRSESFAAGVAFARRFGTETGLSASAADFAYYALRSAQGAPAEPSDELLDGISAHVEAAVEAKDGAMSVDDRSDALRILREIALHREQSERARALAERQRALLDGVMKEASPEVVMTFNWPASEVYAFLGIPEALVPVVTANMEALPEEYDPPYRLAWLWLAAEQPDKAEPMAQRALGLAYGPRKGQVFRLLQRIERAQGDEAGLEAALRGEIAHLESLPEGRASPKNLAQAREALAAMLEETPAPGSGE